MLFDRGNHPSPPGPKTSPMKTAVRLGGIKKRCASSIFTLINLPKSSNNEMMPTSVNNVQGVKSFILLYFVLEMIQQLETTTYIR